MNWNYSTAINVEENMDLPQRLKEANLDWEVKACAFRFGEFGQHVDPYRTTVYRSDTITKVIDTYMNRPVRQNLEIVAQMDNIFKAAGMKMESLGSYAEGSNIYASSRLPESYDINVRQVGDIIKPRLVIVDSHLVDEGLKILVHFERLVCTNGMTTPVKQQAGVINHTGGINLTKLKQVIGQALRMVKVETEVVENLAQTALSIESATLQLIAAFGDPLKTVQDQPPTVKAILNLFEGQAVGGELLSAYGTAYGLLQSVTEYYGHHSKAASETSRFQSILNGNYSTIANKFQRQLVTSYL